MLTLIWLVYNLISKVIIIVGNTSLCWRADIGPTLFQHESFNIEIMLLAQRWLYNYALTMDFESRLSRIGGSRGGLRGLHPLPFKFQK